MASISSLQKSSAEPVRDAESEKPKAQKEKRQPEGKPLKQNRIEKSEIFFENFYRLPKVMPKEMPKDGLSPKTSILYDFLMNCSRPEKELKEKVRQLSAEMSAKSLYQTLGKTYVHLMADSDTSQDAYVLAQYIKELYGYGAAKPYFEEAEDMSRKVMKGQEIYRMITEGDNAKDETHENPELMVRLDDIVNFCLEQGANYNEVKPVYDMLLEVLYGNTDPRWIEAKGKLKEKMKTLETRTAILNEGAELVMEKKVEYEVKNVEAGGTGVTIHKK